MIFYVSLVAYNSVCKYDLIGTVETQFDSTVDEDALDGYTFVWENHPQNVKRGGVGLYIKDAIPSRNRPDLVTPPESIVYERNSIKQEKILFCCYLQKSKSGAGGV